MAFIFGGLIRNHQFFFMGMAQNLLTYIVLNETHDMKCKLALN